MPEPSVRGITQADYQAWRHHPVSKVMLQFYRDFRSQLHENMILNFEGGTLTLDGIGEAKGRCLTLAEMADMPFSAILSFYQEEEEENDAEATQGL